ncbi:MAG: hypothetical protein WCF65_07680 [Parachlamydiaceae bacterium]
MTKGLITQFFLLLIVGIAAFFALYLHTPIKHHQEIPQIPPVSKDIPKATPTVVSKLMTTPLKESYPLITVKVDPTKPLKIGIFGESRGNETEGESFNFVVVSEILNVLKDKQTQVIFFTGNLVAPFEAPVPEKEGSVKQVPKELEQQLQEFSVLYDRILGKDVPFFPVLGNKEIPVPQAAKIFADHFHLKDALLMDGELVYAVSIGPACFIVIPTASIAPATEGMAPKAQSNVLLWLEYALAAVAKNHQYLFVVGHEPAFFEKVTFLKQNVFQRDAFWKILTDNHVLAYFASREHFFDRSNRSGVWQIISGGGGGARVKGENREPFFHTLILVISPDKGKVPAIQVLDVNGRIVGEYELSDHDDPLYQMRISSEQK